MESQTIKKRPAEGDVADIAKQHPQPGRLLFKILAVTRHFT
jgi:hypothetical protein